MENLTKVVSPWDSLLYIHVCMFVFSIPVKLLNITVKTPIALAIINSMHKVQCKAKRLENGHGDLILFNTSRISRFMLSIMFMWRH
jgi:hypothetical protein